jgi:hypothetical protein
MHRNGFAILMTVLLVGAALGPAVATASAGGAAGNTSLGVDVTQDDGVTVSVTDNGTGAPDATVDVATVDENATYNGTGSYTTDANGTVSLPSPTRHVQVDVTATLGNETATTTATLTAGENSTYENFGQSVSAFVSLIDPLGMDGPPGQTIAAFVLANNPSDAVPDHAGPGGNDTQGPPDHAGPGGNDTQGPPDHAGPDGNDTQGPPDHAGPDGEQGPPDHAGPDGDEDDSDEEEEEDDSDEDDADDADEEDDADDTDEEDDGDEAEEEEDDGNNGNGNGPPEGVPGNGR